MDRLIWTAVSGMNASMNRQRMLASNLANAQTTGFRAEFMQFTPMTIKGTGLETRALTDGAVHGALMDPGAVVQTGRPLDLAIDGEALLAVQAADGEEAYTRRGDLSISPAGLLTNGEGFPVLGEDGPISVPPGSQVSFSPEGGVLVRDPANPDAPPAQVGQLKLAAWRGSPLEKGLDGLFRVTGGGALPTDEAATITPGALEGSNVDTSLVLVEMIEAQRLFDIRTKLIATARDLDEGGASLMRMS
jgi:flagellar basal-body rod protein FlgF